MPAPRPAAPAPVGLPAALRRDLLPSLVAVALGAAAIGALVTWMARPGASALTVVADSNLVESGVLGRLLDYYQATWGTRVGVVAAGADRAAALGRSGQADLVLTASSETLWAARRSRWLLDRLVLAGPPADPAGAASGRGALDPALERVLRAGVPLAVAGDGSRALDHLRRRWPRTRTRPWRGLRVTDLGPASALMTAAALDGYWLGEESVFRKLAPRGLIPFARASRPDTILIARVAPPAGDPSGAPRRPRPAAHLEAFLVSEEAIDLVLDTGGRRSGAAPLFLPWWHPSAP